MTSTMHNGISVAELFRTDFRISSEADAINSQLIKELGLSYRYQPARIAIGMSLSKVEQPLPSNNLLGKPIRGETLFGHEELEIATWSALIVEHSNVETMTKREFLALTAAHWERGLDLLCEEYPLSQKAGKNFWEHLITTHVK